MIDHYPNLASRIPEGLIAVPLTPDEAKASVRISLLVQERPTEGLSPLVVLRELMDGRIYLGVLTDRRGHPLQWLEIWVQDPSSMLESYLSQRDWVNNRLLDEHWRDMVDRVVECLGDTLVQTGWETTNTPALFYDPQALRCVYLRDQETGVNWSLCRDEALLAKAKLPAFGTSLHRYLYLPDLPGGSEFAAVSPLSPDGGVARMLHTVSQGLVPINPGGGYIVVRQYGSFGFEPLSDLIGLSASLPADEPPPLASIDTAAVNLIKLPLSSGHLFLPNFGTSSRLAEVLHLKLRLLYDAAESVQRYVQQSQRPMLNLSPESFQVSFGRPARGLPYLWTSRAELVRPDDALAVELATTDIQHFLRGSPTTVSIYQPAEAALPMAGRGSLRIRQVTDTKGGQVVVEGTLVCHERLTSVGTKDLVWLQITLANERLDLYGKLEDASALAFGEFRLHTLPQALPPATVSLLKRGLGIPIPHVGYQILAQLSTPVDLYALGVLAVRILLANEQNPLHLCLDSVLSLARQAAVVDEHLDQQRPLEARIAGIISKDQRFFDLLSPHHLSSIPLTPEQARDVLPDEVWLSTLAAILRCFPTFGSDCPCEDYGDARPGALHRVFDTLMANLVDLMTRTRSLLVVDWQYNREIHSVVRQILKDFEA